MSKKSKEEKEETDGRRSKIRKEGGIGGREIINRDSYVICHKAVTVNSL